MKLSTIVISLGAITLSSCGGAAVAPLAGGTGSEAGSLAHYQGPLTIEKVLYSFKGAPDAAYPYGGLLAAKNGEFYGISNGGGTVGPSGLVDGTVYEISATGNESVVYDFKGGKDGAGSEAGLIESQAGDFFGVTDYGGGAAACKYGCGTVFELRPTASGYSERVLHAFQGGKDGSDPLVDLLLGKNGVLYGTTTSGGTGACSSPSGDTGCGTVFSLTPSGKRYTEKVLYSFQSGTDGEAPRAKLIADSQGNLYGTTEFGGNTNAACGKSPEGNTACGTVFEIAASGGEKILYRFKGGDKDGANPRAALVSVSKTSLVGLTLYGGGSPLGLGTAYELTFNGHRYTERVLYFFGEHSMDGARPDDHDGLTADSSGNLYGATIDSTASPCGCGAVFKLTPTKTGYSESVLHIFNETPDGAQPRGAPTLYNGELYGATFIGGDLCYKTSTYGCGTIYKVKP